MKTNTFLFMGALSFALGACGGTDAPSTTVEISAAEGGTISLGSKESKLEIPAAALAEDTEVTLKVADRSTLPALDNMAEALQIEPAGTVLSTSANLTIELATAPAEGQPVAVHQLLDGVWVDLGSIVVTGKLVQASIAVFGPVAVTVVPKDVPPGDGNRIVGKATWGDGSVASSLPIELWTNDRKLTETLTDAEGKYSFVDLTPGSYGIVLTPMAECPANYTVTVSADKATTLDIVVCGG